MPPDLEQKGRRKVTIDKEPKYSSCTESTDTTHESQKQNEQNVVQTEKSQIVSDEKESYTENVGLTVEVVAQTSGASEVVQVVVDQHSSLTCVVIVDTDVKVQVVQQQCDLSSVDVKKQLDETSQSVQSQLEWSAQDVQSCVQVSEVEVEKQALEKRDCPEQCVTESTQVYEEPCLSARRDTRLTKYEKNMFADSLIIEQSEKECKCSCHKCCHSWMSWSIAVTSTAAVVVVASAVMSRTLASWTHGSLTAFMSVDGQTAALAKIVSPELGDTVVPHYGNKSSTKWHTVGFLDRANTDQNGNALANGTLSDELHSAEKVHGEMNTESLHQALDECHPATGDNWDALTDLCSMIAGRTVKDQTAGKAAPWTRLSSDPGLAWRLQEALLLRKIVR